MIEAIKNCQKIVKVSYFLIKKNILNTIYVANYIQNLNNGSLNIFSNRRTESSQGNRIINNINNNNELVQHHPADIYHIINDNSNGSFSNNNSPNKNVDELYNSYKQFKKQRISSIGNSNNLQSSTDPKNVFKPKPFVKVVEENSDYNPLNSLQNSNQISISIEENGYRPSSRYDNQQAIKNKNTNLFNFSNVNKNLVNNEVKDNNSSNTPSAVRKLESRRQFSKSPQNSNSIDKLNNELNLNNSNKTLNNENANLKNNNANNNYANNSNNNNNKINKQEHISANLGLRNEFSDGIVYKDILTHLDFYSNWLDYHLVRI